jgi:signal transduction histidine kinase/putative methionine-R-sulfoxide reductase with GAF domain
VVHTRAPFIVADAPTVYEEFRRVPHAPAGTRSWLGVPMLVGDRLIGMLALDKREPGFYTQEHARLAETFAAQAAIAVENSRLFQAEREQRELAEALEQAAAAVSSTLDLDQVLDRILEQVERVVAGDAFNIMLVENGAARIVRWRCHEHLGLDDQIGRTTTLPAKYPSLLKMAQTGRPIIILDTALDPDWIPLEGQEWRRSYVAAPIRVKDLAVGFLNVNGTQPGQFGPADARRLEAFASHAATALENAKLFEESKGHAERLAVLYEIGRDITSTLELDALLHLIVERSARLTGADKALILLVDREGEKLTKSVGFGFAPGQIEHITYQEIQDGISGSVLRDRTPTISEDIRIDPRNTGLAMQALEAEDEPGKSIAVAPLFVKGEVIGTLTVVNNVGKPVFSQNDLDLVLMLASQAAVAIENARLYRQVRDYAGELERRVQERTAELQVQYARLDAILHSTTDGILVADAEGEILQANPVAQAWLTQILSPDKAGQLQEAVKDLARQVEESPEMILELTGVDLELSAAPVVEQGMGELSAVVVDIHDISHLKALDRMRTRFVTNVSHELRTPIATIRAYAHLLRETPPGDERWGIYLDALVQETDRQVQLEEDLLQVTRIYAGRLEPESRSTSLNALVDKVVASYRTLTQKRDLALEHHPAEPGPVALVDARHVAQALSILVEDAIRYTPAGGRVIVSTGETWAEGHVWATVTVSDTGERIPADDLPYIFERFFREEEPRSERVSKTGLRLMIVKGIVELQGGQVTVESEESVGSTFTVWLPLADQQERQCSSA